MIIATLLAFVSEILQSETKNQRNIWFDIIST